MQVRLRTIFGSISIAVVAVYALAFGYRAYHLRGEEEALVASYEQRARVAQISLLSSLEDRFGSAWSLLRLLGRRDAAEVPGLLSAIGVGEPQRRQRWIHGLYGFGNDGLRPRYLAGSPVEPSKEAEIAAACAAIPAADPGQQPIRLLAPLRLEASGEWVLPMIATQPGGGCGAYLLLLRSEFLNDYLQRLGIDFTLLTHTDGTILARYPEGGNQTGRSLGTASVFANAYRANPQGTLISISPVDGKKRINAYSALPGLPVIVVAGYLHERVAREMANEWRTFYIALGTSALVVVGLLTLSFLLLQNYRREKRKNSLQRMELDNLWKFVVEGVGLGLWELDCETNRLRYSEQYRTLMKLPANVENEDFTFWQSRVHPDDLPGLLQDLERHLAGQPGHFHVKFRYRVGDNDWHWILMQGLLLARSDSGKPQRMVGTAADITAEEEAAIQMRLAATVFAETSEAITITDATNRIIAVNPAFTQVTGYTAEEVMGKNPRILSSGRQDAGFYHRMWGELQRTGNWQGEIWNRDKRGRVYPEWLSITLVRDRAGEILRHVAIFSDITERKASEERIQHLAHFDHLTHLPNRLLLRDRLQQMIKVAQRNETKIALLFIDLDRFKNVNDTFGHNFGDKLLVEVGRRLVSSIRASDTVSRLGGDEFIVAMPDVASAHDAAMIATKIVQTISIPFTIDETEVRATCSIGVALFPDDGDSIDLLMRNADISMYEAKQEGRSRVYFFTKELNERAAARARIEAAMRKGLGRGEFYLEYQPQFDTESRRLCGLEALVRWRHPEDGLIPPGRFIPVAEETGVIVPLGEEILRLACRQIRAWRADGLQVPVVGLNISAAQLNAEDFIEHLRAVFAEEQAQGSWFDMEITETALVKSGAEPDEHINQLKELGCSVSIDDFGTGYSSMLYLRRFKVDKIKIDQGFVRDMHNDASNAAICSAIISMARSLSMRTIAEGVEVEAEYQFLKQLGCNEIQGYFFARPLPPDEIAAKLRELPAN